MTVYRQLVHLESGHVLLPRVRWCDSFGGKLQGFTFRRRLATDDGLVLVEKADSRVTTAITMLFVFFDLGVLWVNSAGEVVDTVLARPWRLAYLPKTAARYVVETHPCLLQQVAIGDHLQFRENLA